MKKRESLVRIAARRAGLPEARTLEKLFHDFE